MIAIVDAGPLYAVADRTDAAHARCVEVFDRADLELIVPALVVQEVSHLLGARRGARIEAGFLRALTEFEIEAPSTDDWALIADLVERYADFPLGGADASVAVLADRYDTNLILTLDRRHFGALRTKHGQPFRLLPD